MKNFRVDMNVTVGYSVLVKAEDEEDAKMVAEMQADFNLCQGLGMNIEFLSVKEVE